jgi:hypothetical protein
VIDGLGAITNQDSAQPLKPWFNPAEEFSFVLLGQQMVLISH